MHLSRFFSCSRFSGRALTRLWALGALLPMLLLGIAGNVPHEHELRALSALVHGGASQHQEAPSVRVAAPVQQEGPSQVNVLAPSFAAHWSEALCLLCQWASVMGALLLVALALSWFVTRAQIRVFTGFLAFGCDALSLRSRAPPV